MILKEDINKISKMSNKELDRYFESDNYNNLSEQDKISVLRIVASSIEFNDDKSFDEFAEEVAVQEELFNRGLKLNENNIRRVRERIIKD